MIRKTESKLVYDPDKFVVSISIVISRQAGLEASTGSTGPELARHCCDVATLDMSTQKVRGPPLYPTHP
jgi:hypothetical protein